MGYNFHWRKLPGHMIHKVIQGQSTNSKVVELEISPTLEIMADLDCFGLFM